MRVGRFFAYVSIMALAVTRSGLMGGLTPKSLVIIKKECCLEPARVLLQDEGCGEETVQDRNRKG